MIVRNLQVISHGQPSVAAVLHAVDSSVLDMRKTSGHFPAVSPVVTE